MVIIKIIKKEAKGQAHRCKKSGELVSKALPTKKRADKSSARLGRK
jgi:hypothetical protein